MHVSLKLLLLERRICQMVTYYHLSDKTWHIFFLLLQLLWLLEYIKIEDNVVEEGDAVAVLIFICPEIRQDMAV